MKKYLLEALKANKDLTDYEVIETNTQSAQLFYVLNKLETNRYTDNIDTTVTIHVKHDDKHGSANFVITAADDEISIDQKIKETIVAASSIDNKPYDLVEPSDKKLAHIESIDASDLSSVATKCMDAVVKADHFDGVWINSTEIFVNHKVTRFINSKGVDLSYEKTILTIELIPTSINGDGEEFELYLFSDSLEADYASITTKVEEMLRQAIWRSQAIPYSKEMKYDYVSIRGDMLERVLDNFKNDISYANVINRSNHFNVDDEIVPYGLTFTAKPYVKGASASAPIDSNGIILEDTVIIKDGRVKMLHGDNRFGQYLEVDKPTGLFPAYEVTVDSSRYMKNDDRPHIELLFFSSPQLEPSSGYFGGEVRLALYHDGNGNITPITSLSFSGDVYEAIKTAKFSEETIITSNSKTPKIMYLDNIKIH